MSEELIKSMKREVEKEVNLMIKNFLQEKLPNILQKTLDRYLSEFDEKLKEVKTPSYKNDELSGSLSYINDDYERLIEEFQQKEKQKNIAKQNSAIMKELQSQLNEERQSRDSLDQYMRRNKLEFQGIPNERGENIEILIKNLLKKSTLI